MLRTSADRVAIDEPAPIDEPTPVGSRAPEEVIDETQARRELALLHRILHRIGYDDGLGAGHISYRISPDTILVTAREYGWDEMRASHLLRMSPDGSRIEGPSVIGRAARVFHPVIHELRPDIRVAVHNHPEWSTVWAAAGRKPPIYDQFGMFADDDLVLSPEYRADVTDRNEAVAQVSAIGTATSVLLRSHGVLVLGTSIRQAHLKCAVLEHRCRTAWRVEALGATEAIEPSTAASLAAMHDTGEGMRHHFEYASRRELRDDPHILD